jgi:CBS domain-containing protein
MRVSDVLLHKGSAVTTVRDSDDLATVVQLLAAKRIGAVVVQDRWMKLAGIFSERDLVRVLAAHHLDALTLQVGAVMTHSVIICSPSDRVDAALARMTMNRIRHLPVIDNGQLAGMISIGDLVHHRLDEKELEAGVLLDITRMHA